MDTARDLTCGTIGGIVSRVAIHPIDTIKVRMQCEGSPYRGYGDCVKRIIKEEGARSFYRGLGAPVAGAGLENAVLFGVIGRTQALYRQQAGLTSNQRLPLSAQVLSGAVAGAAVSFVLTPMELLKCRMQLENMKPPTERKFSGVYDCGVKSFAREGIRGLFHGHTACLAREIPGNAAWYGCYTVLLNGMIPEGKTKKDLPGWKVALAGAWAGVAYWTAFYPSDVVKTRMQTNPAFQGKSLVSGLGMVYKSLGFKGLYRGYGVTICKGFPCNGILFVVVENLTTRWDTAFADRSHHGSVVPASLLQRQPMPACTASLGGSSARMS